MHGQQNIVLLFIRAYFSSSACDKQNDQYITFQDVCIFLNFPSINNITCILFIINYTVFNYAELSRSKSLGCNWISIFSLGNSNLFARILHASHFRLLLGIQFVLILSTIRS